MEQNLQTALNYIFASEGGMTIAAAEPGGASNLGISMVTYGDWRKAHKQAAPTITDLQNLTVEEATQIYTANFAAPIRFNDLPSGVDYRLLDIAVNLGVTGGIKCLQIALQTIAKNNPVDGKFTDELLALVKLQNPLTLIEDLSVVWIADKAASPHWNLYQDGWTIRSQRVTAQANQMAQAQANTGG